MLSSAKKSALTLAFKAGWRARSLRAISTQAASRGGYAPRPGACPVTSISAPPLASRTTLTRVFLSASWRHATHVRTGSWRCVGIALRLTLSGLDVYAIARELGGEACVLPVATDRQRELRARDQDRRRPRRSIDRHPLPLGPPKPGGVR